MRLSAVASSVSYESPSCGKIDAPMLIESGSRRPGRALPLAISVGAAIFPHDGDSYEALLATADSRMYRDKTRRKRHPGRGAPDLTAEATSLTEVDVQRSAVGII